MDKDENINLRLETGLKARAEIVAKTCGSSVSMILRMLLERLIEHAESQDGKVVFPLEFKTYDIHERSRTLYSIPPTHLQVAEGKSEHAVGRKNHKGGR